MKVKNEETFSVPAEAFAVSAADGAFTLAYSADGVNFTPYTAQTPSNEVLFVSGLPKNCAYKLSGNTQTRYIQY